MNCLHSGICGAFTGILLAITIVLVAAFGLALLLVYHKHKVILENLTAYEIDVNATIDEEIPKILEIFVQSVFDDYRVKFLEADPNLIYITEDKEKNITKEISILCAERLSPAMTHKLSLFWNPDAIASVIADKIYLIVVAYVANHNSTYNDNGEMQPV